MTSPSILISLYFFLLLSSSCYAALQDFCVADLKGPQSPAGFNCRDPTTVMTNDFVFSGLNAPGNTSNSVKSAVRPVFVNQFPGLQGLGLGLGRLDMDVGGVLPIHTHPGASESVVVVKGSISAGFISSTSNKVFLANLKEGDAFLFPQGLLHFIVNVGTTPATAYLSFSSEFPGFQSLPASLFGNDLATQIVQQITFIDEPQIKKLKSLLGGKN